MWSALDVTPFVVEYETASVSACHGAPAPSAEPVHVSTTGRPRWYTQTAAPPAPRSATWASRISTTSSKPGSHVPSAILCPSPARRAPLYCTPSERTISCMSVAATSLTDGRSARAARTRDAVVEALLSLLDEGNFRPTARQVAERAGVSLRSVYVHFDDLEDLFTAAAHNHFERMRDLVESIPGDGPLESRLDAFVRQRERIHEASAQVRRAAVL